jgi:hypothetical protein
MAGNPIQSLLPKDPTSTPIGTELNERAKMQQSAVDALKPTGAPAPKGTAMKPVNSPMDKTKSQGPYGSGKGEKRIDVKDMVKPLGQMHDGGTVPKTGPYIMKEGEKVLTQGDHAKLKSAMGLAHSVLADAPDAEVQPPKVIRAMHIRKASDGSHVIEHHHVNFSHPMEEHTAKNMDELHDHLEQHWGEPNDGEHESENDEDGSPAVVAMQKDLGYKK